MTTVACMPGLHHVRERDSREPDICVYCCEDWASVDTGGDCPLRALPWTTERERTAEMARDEERAAAASALDRWAEDAGDPWMSFCADRIRSGEHRHEEKP